MTLAAADATGLAPLPAWSVLPFAALLLAIAVLPLIHRTERWWESNRNKFIVSMACGAAALAAIAGTHGAGAAGGAVGHAAAEFVPFIVLLFSLYVISGGILITGDLRGAPATNTAVLALGAVAANALGTTGASMLLIRPILRANAGRRHRAHVVVFFIFLVSNVGGLLLPIGDPPLFLGYLRGVPFGWTLGLHKEWMAATASLLVLFYFLDAHFARKEGASAEPAAPVESTTRPEIRVAGANNVLWLAGVVLAAAVLVPGRQLGGWTVPDGAREAAMILCAIASLRTTPPAIREQNRFAYGPIVEVAALFSGLFLAMQPALEILVERGGQLGLASRAGFFWATGGLSSFLDNAPTYLVFADVARAVTPQDAAAAAGATVPFSGGVVDAGLLAAVSCGAVFMGANTYIGNGPNLMVAAIAREDGVRMPTFFGYMLWSGAVLLPLFAALTWVFFR
jgi:Na+/H+ antiporter NhaD/arsenite permease-like protein